MDAHVTVPLVPWWRKTGFWLGALLCWLWFAQGVIDIAVSYGFAVPKALGFVGAVAGLLFSALRVLLTLTNPATFTGIKWLDRGTHAAVMDRRPR